MLSSAACHERVHSLRMCIDRDTLIAERALLRPNSRQQRGRGDGGGGVIADQEGGGAGRQQ